MTDSTIIAILVSLILSAFFSGMEIAFVSSNRLKIELENKQGKFSAKILSFFLKNQSKFIGTMLVGNNIALVVYGIFMTKLLEPVIVQFTNSDVAIAIVQTIVSTLLVLISAEFLPKTIFRINPNKTLSFFAIPVNIFYFFLYPIVLFTIGLSNKFLKLIFKLEEVEDTPVFGKIDLDHYLKEATEFAEDHEEIENEVQIFQNALDFANVKVRECMVPRTEILALALEDSIEELRQKFIDTGYSKILIYRDTIDNIIGYTHSYELFKQPEAIKNILLPVTIVPESMSANDALKHLLKQKKSIAVVVDEFGGTSGMLTLEDVVEEIFGEIEDEHDSDVLVEEVISERKFLFSGRLEIDYLNDQYKLNIPESDDYETLAGFIISVHEDIPEEKEQIRIENFVMEITKMEDNRIDELLLTIVEGEG